MHGGGGGGGCTGYDLAPRRVYYYRGRTRNQGSRVSRDEKKIRALFKCSITGKLCTTSGYVFVHVIGVHTGLTFCITYANDVAFLLFCFFTRSSHGDVVNYYAVCIVSCYHRRVRRESRARPSVDTRRAPRITMASGFFYFPTAALRNPYSRMPAAVAATTGESEQF